MLQPVRPLPWWRRLLAALLLVAMLGVQLQQTAAAAQHAADWAGWVAGTDGQDGDAPAPDGKRALQVAVDPAEPKEPPGAADLALKSADWGHAHFVTEAPDSIVALPPAPHAPAAPERPPRR